LQTDNMAAAASQIPYHASQLSQQVRKLGAPQASVQECQNQAAAAAILMATLSQACGAVLIGSQALDAIGALGAATIVGDTNVAATKKQQAELASQLQGLVHSVFPGSSLQLVQVAANVVKIMLLSASGSVSRVGSMVDVVGDKPLDSVLVECRFRAGVALALGTSMPARVVHPKIIAANLFRCATESDVNELTKHKAIAQLEDASARAVMGIAPKALPLLAVASHLVDSRKTEIRSLGPMLRAMEHQTDLEHTRRIEEELRQLLERLRKQDEDLASQANANELLRLEREQLRKEHATLLRDHEVLRTVTDASKRDLQVSVNTLDICKRELLKSNDALDVCKSKIQEVSETHKCQLRAAREITRKNRQALRSVETVLRTERE